MTDQQVQITEVQATTAEATTEAERLLMFARSFEVTNAQTNQEAADFQNACKKEAKRLDDKRKRWLEHVLAQQRMINGEAMPVIKMFKEAATEMGKPMIAYSQKLDKARQEQQRVENERADKLRRELLALAEKNRQRAEADRKAAQEIEDEQAGQRAETEEAQREAQAAALELRQQAEADRRAAQQTEDTFKRENLLRKADIADNMADVGEIQINTDHHAAQQLADEQTYEREKALRRADRADARADEQKFKAETTVAATVAAVAVPNGITMVTVYEHEVVSVQALAQAAVGGLNIMVVDSPPSPLTGVAYELANGKWLIVNRVEPRPELLALLDIDRGALRRYISAVKDQVVIPGVRVTKSSRPQKSRS